MLKDKELEKYNYRVGFFRKKRIATTVAMTTMTLQYMADILGLKLFNLKIRSVTPIFFHKKNSFSILNHCYDF
jgi:hypothetical protein